MLACGLLGLSSLTSAQTSSPGYIPTLPPVYPRPTPILPFASWRWDTGECGWFSSQCGDWDYFTDIRDPDSEGWGIGEDEPPPPPQSCQGLQDQFDELDCELEPITNGCTNSPNEPYWDGSFVQVSFLQGCNLHDVCYQSVSGTQFTCDYAFRTNLENECEGSITGVIQAACSEGGGFNCDPAGFPGVQQLIHECKGKANIYAGTVMLFGNNFFQDAQKSRRCRNLATQAAVQQCSPLE
jgi:hypothetical protein